MVSTLRLLAIGAACAFTAAASAPPPPPPPVNLTVFRITPKNYTGCTNMNTGDAPGDAFFGLYELALPLICSNARYARIINCQNVPILSIPHNNLYAQMVLSVQDRFGDYNECNPDPRTGLFECKQGGSHGHHECWYDNPYEKAHFSDVCQASQCECPAIQSAAVGREYPSDVFGHMAGPPPPPPSPPPAKCTAELAKVCPGLGGKQQACATCVEAHKLAIYAACGFRAQTYEEEYCYGGGHGGFNPFTWVGALANLLNGTWYSTQSVGQGKFWSLSETKRVVNATCVNKNMIAAVQAKNQSCWTGCGAVSAKNQSSPCWITCLFQTLTGNKTIGIAPMTKPEIVDSFIGSFGIGAGSCPEVPQPGATGAWRSTFSGK